jgi:hypothetical protein
MSRKQFEEDREIMPTECMLDFLPEKEPLQERTPLLQKFLSKMREIQSIGYAKGLEPGHCMQLINRQFGYQTWRQIRWSDFELIKQYIELNAHRYLEIVDPTNYETLQAIINKNE